jgi:4-amino-4-deoxy-L-arabinose transferase-like glycosyltransferase
VIDSKVAKRKRRKRSRARIILLFVLTPLIVWALAFLVWLYWNDIAKNLTPARDSSNPAAKAVPKLEKDDTRGRSDETRPKEKILDEDRKKLDEIIRRENHKTSGNK